MCLTGNVSVWSANDEDRCGFFGGPPSGFWDWIHSTPQVEVNHHMWRFGMMESACGLKNQWREPGSLSHLFTRLVVHPAQIVWDFLGFLNHQQYDKHGYQLEPFESWAAGTYSRSNWLVSQPLRQKQVRNLSLISGWWFQPL